VTKKFAIFLQKIGSPAPGEEPHIFPNRALLRVNPALSMIYRLSDMFFTAAAADDDVNHGLSDVSLDESRHDAGSESSDDVTTRYPAEVIVEGQQMNKVGHQVTSTSTVNSPASTSYTRFNKLKTQRCELRCICGTTLDAFDVC